MGFRIYIIVDYTFGIPVSLLVTAYFTLQVIEGFACKSGFIRPPSDGLDLVTETSKLL